jgi:hypothetical protein
LPCHQRGSIGLSQGLFTGNRHTRIRPPPVRFTGFQLPTSRFGVREFRAQGREFRAQGDVGEP